MGQENQVPYVKKVFMVTNNFFVIYGKFELLNLPLHYFSPLGKELWGTAIAKLVFLTLSNSSFK